MQQAILARQIGMAVGTVVSSPASLSGFVDSPLISIPLSAGTPAGFRDWAFSAAFPTGARGTLVNGSIFLDMTSEHLDTHNFVKLEVTSVLYMLVKASNLGLLASDGALITNEKVGLSSEPDACFASHASLRSGKVRRVRSKSQGKGQSWEGVPNWVLEVVSDSSVQKDTVLLPAAYHRAGILEYWLIDARKKELDFTIFVWQKAGYVAQPRKGGWITSPVFGCRFSLQRRMIDEYWNYELRSSPNIA